MLSDLFQRRFVFLYEFYNLKYFIRSCVLVFYVKIDQSHHKNTTDISLNVTDFLTTQFITESMNMMIVSVKLSIFSLTPFQCCSIMFDEPKLFRFASGRL